MTLQQGWKVRATAVWLAALVWFAAQPCWAVSPTAREIARAHDWTAARFGKTPTADPPFSFIYGDSSSADLFKKWKIKRRSRPLDKARVEHLATFTDPKTHLVVACRAVEYLDFPTVEWTLSFKNSGTNDTPIISDIRALDVALVRDESGEFVLHWNKGDTCAPDSYQPMTDVLGPSASKQISPAGGRPTNGGYPYWNITTGGGGTIAVISWAGQWSASFERDAGQTLRVRAGQELTHFKLSPGEEVRSPLAVLQFYDGGWVRGQNIWRRWMIAHNVPKLDGKPLRPFASACNGNHYPGIITNATTELLFLRRYLEEGVKPDFWWEDAGWYKCGNPPDWVNTGTWEVDPARWPKGLREVSDWCRTKGIKTIVWFEPERVAAGTWLADNHPDWVFGGKAGGLLNLGNPVSRRWLTARISEIITKQGIDLYRQDFNIDPLAYWRANDAEDRQGITEIKHITGYFAYWDELKRRHHGMLIDSCSSGGRRNDLETLRRAVPLLRSDNIFDPLAEQCHTYGISFWVPFNGTGFMTFDKYLIRSAMSPEFTMGVDTRLKDADYAMLRKVYEDWKLVSPCYFGDYYPLTPHSLEKNAWMGWQFDRPETGEGMVQAFRREECAEGSLTLKLQGLDPEAVYAVKNLDSGEAMEATGRALTDQGLTVTIADRPGSVLLSYRRVR